MNKYYSQYEQDKFITENFFKTEYKGFFIEIGADDGIDKSNTYFLELSGWNGICIEPSPSRFRSLKQNRKCEVLNLAISSSEKEVEFLDMTGYGKGLSGIIENYNPKHIDRIERETANNPQTLSKQKVTVKTRRLDHILRERGITKVDYCSIDVEGSELEILKSIDFSEVFFGVMTIEDPYDSPDIKAVMSDNNFKLLRKIGPDLLYINNNFEIK